MKTLKTSADVINYLYYNVTIITKDRGNRGFFVKHDDVLDNYKTKYEFISKKSIIAFLIRNVYDQRKRKLIALQIMGE